MSESDQNSHSFQIFGSKQFKSDASFKEGEIADALIQLRGALRKAAWGNEEEFVKNKDSYKYEKGSGSLQKLTKDLILLATRGYEFYTALIRDIAVQNQDTSPQAQVNALEDLMLEPGYVQFVLQKGANHVLPLACLYDYPLDTGLPDFKLCSNFQEALKQKQSLTLCSCFQGHCPSREDKSTICPSGFWGYRHYLGMPQSIKFIHSSPAEIFYTDKPAFAISVWKNFNSRELHVKNLTSNKRVTWKYADDRASTLTILKDKNLHLVYFYCHGGAYPSYPYLEVGDNRNYKITPSHINPNNGIYWEESHPLVFLNGCHTTGLSPERALNFVEAFVENALCAGVIGTEITIFESLASDFFEFFIERFTQGDPVAKAVRDARLHILQQYNPLGLVYIPFVMGGLQLVKKAS